MFDGELPGDRRFYSAFSGDSVYWPQLMDELHEMFVTSTNWMDLTDSEDDGSVHVNDENLYSEPYPTNIGAFRIYFPFHRFDIDPVRDDGADGDTEMTQSTAESTAEQ